MKTHLFEFRRGVARIAGLHVTFRVRQPDLSDVEATRRKPLLALASTEGLSNRSRSCSSDSPALPTTHTPRHQGLEASLLSRRLQPSGHNALGASREVLDEGVREQLLARRPLPCRTTYV